MNIILKCDDFWGKDWEREKVFLDVVVEMKIKISLGIIGYGFANANQEAIDYLLKHADIIEPFNHSFWHAISEPVKEFYKTSLEYQRASIYETQKIILERMGFSVETIGFPANACDQVTLGILRGCDQIKNIYYTEIAHNRAEIEKIGKKIINIDSKTVFQIHPFAPDFIGLDDFRKMISEKIDQGNQFIFPSEI